jgi:hypothetical protein
MAENINTEDTQRALTMLERAAIDAAKANEKSTISAGQLKNAFDAFGRQLGSNVVTLGKTVASTGDGMSKFGGVINSTAESVGNLAEIMLKGFGPLGFIIGGLVKVVGALGVASMKQTDQLMSSYRNLSELGDLTSGGLDELSSNLHRVGLVAEEAGKFEESLRKVTPELSNLGSVSTGVAKYVDTVSGLIGPNNKIEIGLENIGYTTDAIRDGTADYLAKQARQGTLQGKSIEQLRDESEKYLYSLRELSELTGLQRDQAQKLIDEQMRDFRYNRYLSELEASGKQKDAENTRAYMVAYQATFGKEAAQGLQEKIYNHGAIVGELSVRSHQATMGKDYEVFQQVQKGNIDAAHGLKQIAEANHTVTQRYSKTIDIAGDSMKDVTGDMEMMNGAQATLTRSYEKINEKVKESSKREDEVAQNNKNDQIQRQLRIAADEALREVAKITTEIFTRLNQAMLKFGKTLASVVDWMSGWVPGMTKTHLADSFRDLDDNAADLLHAKREELAHSRALTQAQKDLADVTDDSKFNIEDQVKAQKKLVESLKDTSENAKTEREKAIARGKLIGANNRLDQLTNEEKEGKMHSKVHGKIDIPTIINMRKARIAELEAQEKADKAAIERLNAEHAKMSGEGGMEEPTTTIEKGSMAGLKIKKGDVQSAGATVDPKLIEIARQVQSNVAGFKNFTGFNDNYHQEKAPQSAHTKGRAFDFTLDHKPSIAEGDAIVRALIGMGAKSALDEYNHPSSNAIGSGHIHAEISGKTQGLFKGPDSGYLLQAHGEEALLNKQGLSNLITKTQMPNMNPESSDIFSDMLDALMSLKDEITELKNISRNSLTVNEDILTYTKA